MSRPSRSMLALLMLLTTEVEAWNTMTCASFQHCQSCCAKRNTHIGKVR